MTKKILFISSIIVALSIVGFSYLLFSNNATSVKKNQSMENPIMLPNPKLSGSMSVEESLLKRRSVRSYKDKSLSLEQVSQILWSAYGVSDDKSIPSINLKTAPSAGATYPLEIYLLAGKVESLEPGLYKYDADNHSLSLHISGDLRSEVAKACLGQRMLEDAPASIIYNAVYSRIESRYGQRGIERYVMMDIGHSSQNVYLQATAIGLASCAIGAFNDQELENIIKPQGEEIVLYLMPIGYEK